VTDARRMGRNSVGGSRSGSSLQWVTTQALGWMSGEAQRTRCTEFSVYTKWGVFEPMKMVSRDSGADCWLWFSDTVAAMRSIPRLADRRRIGTAFRWTDNGRASSPAKFRGCVPFCESAMKKIGLALSGGGFRATLYHLGLIRFLRDAGLLQQV